ncbi:hypothetical protein [Promicromonospora sp. NPDC050880]|uniref:hypothetical protein n=1 Tax=Promicromonospora sp. NPDC050880 TaxID=3364406 RepID=UPI00379B4427
MIAVRLARVTAAELDKLRSLPMVSLTVAGTVSAGVVLAVALTAVSAQGAGPATPPVATVSAGLPYVQAGLLLLGVLPVAQEYTGRQLGTTLAAVPHRGVLLTAKTVAALAVLAFTAAVAVGAMTIAALVTARLVGEPAVAIGAASAGAGGESVSLAGAGAYLVLIGLLAHGTALLVRHLVPALVTVLGLVLIMSPLLSGLTRHARWLPDRAAAQLYQPTDTVLTELTGALVALAWIVVLVGGAAVRFVRRDP